VDRPRGQAAIVTGAGGSSSPVHFEFRERRRVKLCDSYTQGRRILLWRWDGRPLPIHGNTAHRHSWQWALETVTADDLAVQAHLSAAIQIG
jgi:hypothetical protein